MDESRVVAEILGALGNNMNISNMLYLNNVSDTRSVSLNFRVSQLNHHLALGCGGTAVVGRGALRAVMAASVDARERVMVLMCSVSPPRTESALRIWCSKAGCGGARRVCHCAV